MPGYEVRARKHVAGRMLEADSNIKNTDNLYNKLNSFSALSFIPASLIVQRMKFDIRKLRRFSIEIEED